jgi:SAM-dependent methyltransferase
VKTAASLYVAVREREGRLYPDDVVAGLPGVPASDPHRAEWLARGASARRLTAYFRRQRRPLRILDLGCGNGWLAAALSRLPAAAVHGVDTNGFELAQAARVFGASSEAAFAAADIFRPPFGSGTFDAVVIASSVQYFEDLGRLLAALQTLLRPGGEVHVLDSPFYHEGEVEAARARSLAYYEALGLPAMAASYHHHTWRELDGYDVSLIYNPSSLGAKLRRRLGRIDSPFPWLRVRFTR